MRAMYADILYASIDRLIGSSTDAEILLSDLEKEVRRRINQMPWRERLTWPLLTIRQILNHYTDQQVIVHYTALGWNVAPGWKSVDDSSTYNGFLHFWK
jgi:hypothetical protein